MTEKQTPDAPKESNATTRGRKVAIMAIIGVFVCVCAGGGVYAFHRHQLAQAVDACQNQTSQLSKATSTADRLKDSGQFKSALAIDESHVQNKTSVTDLRDAVQAAERTSLKVPSCQQLSVQGTRTLTKELQKRTVETRNQTTMLSAAADAVLASRDAKVLADAKASLVKAVKAAQGTLDSSHGKVADNKTRVTLQQAIDAANKVLSDKSVKDPKRYQDAQSKLTAPVKAVNGSVAAKVAADKAAADAAAAKAAAQAQARSSSGSSGSSGSSSSGSYSRSTTSGGSSSGTGSYTGSGSSGSTSRNSTGSTSGSSGSSKSSTGTDWGAWADSRKNDNAGCTKGNNGCPIG